MKLTIHLHAKSVDFNFDDSLVMVVKLMVK
jgi:hypothetical protein